MPACQQHVKGCAHSWRLGSTIFWASHGVMQHSRWRESCAVVLFSAHALLMLTARLAATLQLCTRDHGWPHSSKDVWKHVISMLQGLRANPAAYAASACSYPSNALLQVFQRTLHLLERLTTDGAMPAYWDPCSTDQAVVAACFWIATKAEGNRNTVPSRTLLTRAIATVAPSVLIHTEMQVLFALRWNVGATEELQG